MTIGKALSFRLRTLMTVSEGSYYYYAHLTEKKQKLQDWFSHGGPRSDRCRHAVQYCVLLLSHLSDRRKSPDPAPLAWGDQDQKKAIGKKEEPHVPETTSLERTIENLRKWRQYGDNRHNLYLRKTHQWRISVPFRCTPYWEPNAEATTTALQASFGKEDFMMAEKVTESGRSMHRGADRSLQHAWKLGSLVRSYQSKSTCIKIISV